MKIKGANIDIDFSTVEAMDWAPSKCPKDDNSKCAVKNTSICNYFGGVEAPDVVICNFKNDSERV